MTTRRTLQIEIEATDKYGNTHREIITAPRAERKCNSLVARWQKLGWDVRRTGMVTE